jgi:hypothetical protein
LGRKVITELAGLRDGYIPDEVERVAIERHKEPWRCESPWNSQEWERPILMNQYRLLAAGDSEDFPSAIH